MTPQQPLDDIRIRNQAIRNCRLCDPAGYLPEGNLCHHNPEQTQTPERAAAKTRARQAIAEALRKAAYKPEPDHTHDPCEHCGKPDHTRYTCPQREDQPA